MNDRIYHTINNGVYRAGFATAQAAYEEAFYQLFDSLGWVENLLSRQRYLAGNQLTEADWRLFTTLIRFDAVYFGHFKTNRRGTGGTGAGFYGTPWPRDAKGRVTARGLPL